MQSLMIDRFAAYGRLCRLGGCFFVERFSRVSLESARVTWKTLYTLYSASCLIFTFGTFFCLETLFADKTSDRTSVQSDQFSQNLLMTQHLVVGSKMFVNFLSMVAGSGELLEFFRMSASFEKSSGFVPSRRSISSVREYPWPLLRTLLVTAALASSYFVLLYFNVVHFTSTVSREWALAFRILCPVAGLCMFLYDSLCYMVLRCGSDVLLDYLRAQLTAFQNCSKSHAERSGSQATRRLEAIRLDLCSIRKLIQALNNSWKVCLAGTGAGVILVDCVALHSIFHDGIFNRDVLSALPYCAHLSLSFMDLVYRSQALMDETQKLKNATKAIRTSEASGIYAQELRYLHESIDPKDMCFSGGGFFNLSKSLLVSMTGSIITYTVILVETTDELSGKMDAAI